MTCKALVEGFAPSVQVNCSDAAQFAGYCRVHAQLELQNQRARFERHQKHAGEAWEKTVELEQALGLPGAPQRLFEPDHLIMPIDQALELVSEDDEAADFIRQRAALGDPGPVHAQKIRVLWTDQSELEEERASRDRTLALGVFRSLARRIEAEGLDWLGGALDAIVRKLMPEVERFTGICSTNTFIVRIEQDEDESWRVEIDAPALKSVVLHHGAVSREEGLAVALVLFARNVLLGGALTTATRVLDEALGRAVEMYDEQLPA